MVQVVVHNNNADQALKKLRREMQKESIYRSIKLKRHYEKPSQMRQRRKSESIRRIRKLRRKKQIEDI